MNITVRKFTAKDTTEWDEFVERSNNGTIFHLRSFLSYHIDRKFKDHSLIFEKKGKMIGLFPAAIIEEKRGKFLHSHPGASFGGFVFIKLSLEDAESIVKGLENYCCQNKFHKIFFVQSPTIYHNERNDTMEYLLHWYKYEVKEYYISSMIDIRNNKNSIEYLHSRKRRYIKNYLNNNEFTIKWENNFEHFYPILIKNKKRHHIKPTHSLNELKKLNKILPKKLHLLLLYHKNELIGGTLNIIANKRCGIVFYNMINFEYNHLQPAAIQIFESINWAKKYNLNYLDLGVSQQPKAENPLTPHASLIYFKEQLGASAIIRKAFQKTIN